MNPASVGIEIGPAVALVADALPDLVRSLGTARYGSVRPSATMLRDIGIIGDWNCFNRAITLDRRLAALARRR